MVSLRMGTYASWVMMVYGLVVTYKKGIDMAGYLPMALVGILGVYPINELNSPYVQNYFAQNELYACAGFVIFCILGDFLQCATVYWAQRVQRQAGR